MPTYQYACTECGGQLEAVQKFTDEPLTVHEDCGGRLRKVFSPVGIVFKGSGFYKTDSRGSAPSGASAGTSKDGESKNGESKNGESKNGESKGGESKQKSGGDTAPAPASSSSSSAASSSAGSSGSSGSSGEKVA